jgi:hypothetical protein
MSARCCPQIDGRGIFEEPLAQEIASGKNNSALAMT